MIPLASGAGGAGAAAVAVLRNANWSFVKKIGLLVICTILLLYLLLSRKKLSANSVWPSLAQDNNNNSSSSYWQRQLYTYLLSPEQLCRNMASLGGVIMYTEAGVAVVDGDKWICLDDRWQPPPSDCLVYSFGINNEWSFDRDIIARFGCSVFGFDPSMIRTANNTMTDFGAHFLQIGLVGERIRRATFETNQPANDDVQLAATAAAAAANTSTATDAGAKNPQQSWNGVLQRKRRSTAAGGVWPEVTVDEVSRRLGHQHRPLHYLKVDVEGDEWPWLEQEPAKTFGRVRQLGIEVHLAGVQYDAWARRYVLALAALRRHGFRLAHVHANRVLAPTVTVPGLQQQQPLSQWYELLLLNVNDT